MFIKPLFTALAEFKLNSFSFLSSYVLSFSPNLDTIKNLKYFYLACSACLTKIIGWDTTSCKNFNSSQLYSCPMSIDRIARTIFFYIFISFFSSGTGNRTSSFSRGSLGDCFLLMMGNGLNLDVIFSLYGFS